MTTMTEMYRIVPKINLPRPTGESFAVWIHPLREQQLHHHQGSLCSVLNQHFHFPLLPCCMRQTLAQCHVTSWDNHAVWEPPGWDTRMNSRGFISAWTHISARWHVVKMQRETNPISHHPHNGAAHPISYSKARCGRIRPLTLLCHHLCRHQPLAP